MKEEIDNKFGVLSVVFGILSIVLLVSIYFLYLFLKNALDMSSSMKAIIFGIVLFSLFGISIIGKVGIMFGIRQRDKSNNKWAVAGILLSIIGIIISVILFLLFFLTFRSFI